MNRYFSLIPVVIIFTTACDQKAPTVESAPRMVKVAQVTAVGNTQQRTFPARIESGDSTELSFKRGGQSGVARYSSGGKRRPRGKRWRA